MSEPFQTCDKWGCGNDAAWRFVMLDTARDLTIDVYTCDEHYEYCRQYTNWRLIWEHLKFVGILDSVSA